MGIDGDGDGESEEESGVVVEDSKKMGGRIGW